MPPFSPAAKGFLPNSMNEFCPEKPCQPSLRTQGGSIRPVERSGEQLVAPVVGLVVHWLGGSLALRGQTDLPVQSALAQYTEPGTRWAMGSDTRSAVFAIMAAMLELLHGKVPLAPHDGLLSAGPPASYTTCVPVFLLR